MAGSRDNIIYGNFIGTGIDGTTSLGNKFNVQLRGSKSNTIGGGSPGQRNIISGAFLEQVDGQNQGGSGVVLTNGINSSGEVVSSTR